jgi:16S rRNA (guanine966-N2)-methyltransferase
MRIISGRFKNKKVNTPSGMDTRPTSSRLREALFNICQGYIEGTRFLDLFAGSGAMGLEAISRGASHATFIDKSKDAAKVIHQNVKEFDVSGQTTILCGDCLQYLPRLSEMEAPFYIIYLDPPYENWEGSILTLIDESDLLAKDGHLFIEEAEEPTAELKNLHLVSKRSAGRSKLFEYVRKSK